MRNLVENALALTGKLAPKQPDPVSELATAAALLKTATKKRQVQVPATRQLGLF